MEWTKVFTPERFASGRTLDDYLTYLGSEANLKREASDGGKRRDFSGFLRQQYEQRQLQPDQIAALKWLVTQPGAPAKLLVIAEDWSSDCRRDIPSFARIGETMGLEVRFFDRDGERTSHMRPEHAGAPGSNMDLLEPFLNQKNGGVFQSIPVAVFLTSEMEYVYHYTEYPAIYDKDFLQAQMRAAKPGESEEETRARFPREFGELQASPFFRVWACAAVDEMISGLHRHLAYQ